MVNGNVTTLGPRKSRDKEGVANPSIFISMVDVGTNDPGVRVATIRRSFVV